MKISATIELDPGYVHYSLDLKSGSHYVGVWTPRDHVLRPFRVSGSAGHVLNALIPYRDVPEVAELISWLSR